jgi:hypothetical protein
METKNICFGKGEERFEQQCYTCQECRFAPFSTNPGQPVLITKPRFSNGANGTIDVAEEGNSDESVVSLIEY